ncbi:uncharacterized protein Fot_34448 [Forsythia ovata]|uniref:Prolamin-like domain-containing protein n=1 Tax=Forsythia ovata TaxID=205694 RepID=A0ABD1SIS0_9LAMI
MAFQSASVKGALVLFMIACMVTSSVSSSRHVWTAQPKLLQVAAISEVALAVEGFLPCLKALKGIEGCAVNILKAAFGLPLDDSCCQVVNQIAKNCLPKGFPLSQLFLPVVLENCINVPLPPASS